MLIINNLVLLWQLIIIIYEQKIHELKCIKLLLKIINDVCWLDSKKVSIFYVFQHCGFQI